MKQQDQTYTSGWLNYNGKDMPIHGSCLITCYASYLDLDVDECPQFQFLFECRQPQGFEEVVIEAWLKIIGYKEVFHDTDPSISGYSDYYFASGMSERGLLHLVIYKDGQLFHDPHPSKAGIIKPETFTTLEKI